MKIGIIKEYKSPPDKRVVFSPVKCVETLQKFPQVEFFIEKSDIRCFSDSEYEEMGLKVVTDLSNCDVLIGVKEVPIEKLIDNKKYFFFSHTIKKQPYNKNLLQQIVKKNIELFDHETIVDKNNNRLIGFGYYAGVIGAYNGLRAYGLKNHTFSIPKAIDLKDRQEFNSILKSLSIPDMKILLTGKGRVGSGTKEVLDFLKIKEVSAHDFINETYSESVYVNIDVLDYNYSDSIENTVSNFYNYPEKFRSTFSKFLSVSDIYFAGHYHNPKAPKLITLDDIKNPDFSVQVIADISCDIDGPIASTIRPSTIENPTYGFHKEKLVECDFLDENALAVMAVDNLPCELPRDSSEMFGEMFLKYVIPSFFNNDQENILKNSKITSEGSLTDRFSYLSDYIQ
ncbi:MAG: alanine dehydrogenase [Flavobacteriaceae bacterium]|nr:alanine dehydrogenase [Flavobacteriaceae bacterium]